MSTPARRLREAALRDAAPASATAAEASTPAADAFSELGALQAVSAAVEGGAGLPEVVRAAARALDASLMLVDTAGAVLAVAARSPADERALASGAAGVATIELRLGEEPVGRLLLRPRTAPPAPAVLSLVKALVASEVERVRAPDRASEQALTAFLAIALGRDPATPSDVLARAGELGVALEAGGSVVVARAHPLAPKEEDWRSRVLAVAERGARAAAPSALAGLVEGDGPRAGEVVILVPGPDPGEQAARRVAEGVLRELEAGLGGFSFAVGRSRLAAGAADLPRAGHEALLAANVAEDEAQPASLAFEETGAYRLLLPAMSEHPEELERFYADTLEPLIAYDEQYETGLVPTLETFLDCDGNVAQTAQRLYTHRHTIRYRLDRVHELSGLDVSSSDGREKLSLGLKSMRVLGIAAPRGPATEAGAEGGRVPRTR